MSLSIQGGGKVGLEPGQTDAPRTIEQLFVFDLQLPDYPRVLNLLGARVHVRFVHDREPLSRQWYRAVRRLFLSEFDV
jgi:putative peptide zinc metalloprotease protein